MKRNRREHGRILSVETMQRGSALDVDAAAGATSITVVDGGDFDEDGGWLYIGAQVIEFTACDDDTGVITLATALAAAAEQGDPVAVYDPLYAEVVDYQVALVQLDGEYDNPDPVEAEVAEGVGDLPEGDRGKAGESCTLLRVADDEWEVVGVGGRPRKSRSVRWEQDDFYTLTADDIASGTMTMPLTHRPCDEALTCVLAGAPQQPTEWTINYDAQTLTIPLEGWEQAGMVAWVHYAYRKGISTGAVVAPMPTLVTAGSSRNSAQASVDIAGVQVGDVIVAAGFSGGGVALSATGVGATGFTTIASGQGQHNSYGFQTVDGVLGVKIADAVDVDQHTINASGGGVVLLSVLVYSGAALPASADAGVLANATSTPDTGSAPVPAVALSGPGVRAALFGTSGGGGQVNGLTVGVPLTSRSEHDTALTGSTAAADQSLPDGGAAAEAVAYSTTENWPWVSFAVAIEGA